MRHFDRDERNLDADVSLRARLRAGLGQSPPGGSGDVVLIGSRISQGGVLPF